MDAIVAMNAGGRNVFVRCSVINRFLTVVLALVAALVLSGCASNSDSGISLRGLAKSDIDLVADAHRRQADNLTEELLVKLYKRNPRELKRGLGASVEQRLKQFNEGDFSATAFAEFGDKRGIEAIRLAFDSDYAGDRVFALAMGLADMLHESYNRKREFYLFDELDQQKLYNSARNVEVVAWLLRSSLDAQGQPLILSNHFDPSDVNISFERLVGKLIANQDMMAVIVAGKNQRAINTVAHSVMSMTLIPL